MPANNHISVLEKTFRVLEAFQGDREVALGDLTVRTHLVKSNVFRILFTLEKLGYVEKIRGGRYSLTSRLSRLAGDYPPRSNLSSLAAPFMADLLRQFQETINLGVLDGGEVLYIHVLECSHAFRLAAHAGMRSPLHSTALGKCLLSRLPRPEIEALLKANPPRKLTTRTITEISALCNEAARVRSRGYAVDGGEDSQGARCIGAPILDPQGHVCAAISISGPAMRVKPSRDKEIAGALMETCREISTLLGYTGRLTDKVLSGGR